MSQKLLICIGGMSGSGKSTLAKALHARFPNAVHLDNDVVRKEMWGVPLHMKLPKEAYTPENYARFDRAFADMIGHNLQEGKTVIVSATFRRETLRHAVTLQAEENQARFAPIWLDVQHMHDIFTRVSRRLKEGTDPSDITPQEIRESQFDLIGADTGWPMINAHMGPDKVLAEALRLIAPPRQNKFTPPAQK